MERSLFLGLLGLAAAGSIAMHIERDHRPAYSPRSITAHPQDPRGAWEWLNIVRRDINTGQVEPDDIRRMSKAVAAYARTQHKSASYPWVEMGPDNVGGRVLGICVDPADHQRIWAGGVSGGMFRSEDGGNTWHHLGAFSNNLVVVSIAKLGNGHLYVATGSIWENAGGGGGSGFIGKGIYRSDDGGDSFSAVDVLSTPTPWSGSADWALCNRIVADGGNPSRLYIASTNPGARVYDEGSNSVSTLSGISSTLAASDVDVSGDGSTVLFAVGNGDAYLSTDFGGTFHILGSSTGFPQSAIGRLEMAISPDDPHYMYAFASTSNGRMSGAWSSTDQGATWFRIWPSNLSDTDPNRVPSLDIFRDNHQGQYDCAVAVRPGHPDEVWLGGVELWKTSLNGQPNQLALPNNYPGCFNCVHADVHEIVFADANTAFVGCDGGVYKTPTAGSIFYQADRDLAITQYYSVAYNANGQVGGGAQDNGSTFISGHGTTRNEAVDLTGGDGFDADFSQLDTNVMFTTIYNGALYRSNDHGNNFGEFYDANVTAVAVQGGLGAGLGDFYTNIRLWENPNDLQSVDSVRAFLNLDEGDTLFPGEARTIPYHGGIVSVPQYGTYVNQGSEPIVGPWTSDTLRFQDRVTSVLAAGFIGTQGIWVTRQAMNFNVNPSWAKVVNNAIGNVTCLEWSADGDALFYGTQEGEVYRITGFNTARSIAQMTEGNAQYGLAHTQILGGSAVVTGLAPDPSDPQRVVATFGNYGSSAKVKLITNALGTPTVTNLWNVPSELQGMPVYDAVVHKADHNIIAVGTEFGIWVTDDGGNSWTMQTDGIEGVPVFAMRQQTWDYQHNPFGPDYIKNPYVIYAGTHGRGIFRTDALLSIPPAAAAHPNAVNEVVLVPNPSGDQSLVRFTLARQGDVVLNVYDLNGRLLRTVSRRNLSATVQNIPLRLEGMAVGTYLVEVRSGAQHATGRLVVSR